MRGIYSIVNTVTDTVYYGQATNIKKRISRHFRELKSNKHKNPLLQNSWNKYGELSFVASPLIIVEDTNIELTPIEKRYFDSTANKFNLLDPVDATSWTTEMRRAAALRQTGKKLSDSTKEKMSLASKGNTHNLGIKRKVKRVVSEETRLRQSIAQQGNKNAKGHTLSLENRLEQSKRRMGKVHSQETKNKVSLSLLGNTRSLGRTLSEEHRLKTTEGLKKYWKNKKAIEGIS